MSTVRSVATPAAGAIPRTRVIPRRRREARWRVWGRRTGWYFTKWARQALRVLTEPSEAFWDLKRTGDWRAVPVMLAVAVAARMLTLAFTSFHFIYENPNVAVSLGNFELDKWTQQFIRIFTIGMTDFYYTSLPEDVSVWLEMLRILAPFGTWMLAHYAIAQIFYGEGGMKDVAVGSAFALTPYILLSWPASLLMTNVFSLGEKGFYFGWSNFVNLWVVFLFFRWQEVMHDFTPRRTMLVWVVSLVTVILMWALLALLVILTSNTWEFTKELVYEIIAR